MRLEDVLSMLEEEERNSWRGDSDEIPVNRDFAGALGFVCATTTTWFHLWLSTPSISAVPLEMTFDDIDGRYACTSECNLDLD